jgi:hypothetical protein
MGAGTDKTLHDRSQTPESAARRKRTGAPSEHFFLFLSLTKKRCKDDGMQKTVFTSNPKFKTVQVQFIIFSVEQQPQHAAVAGEHQNTILMTSSQIRSGRLTLPSSLISHRSP